MKWTVIYDYGNMAWAMQIHVFENPINLSFWEKAGNSILRSEIFSIFEKTAHFHRVKKVQCGRIFKNMILHCPCTQKYRLLFILASSFRIRISPLEATMYLLWNIFDLRNRPSKTSFIVPISSYHWGFQSGWASIHRIKESFKRCLASIKSHLVIKTKEDLNVFECL